MNNITKDEIINLTSFFLKSGEYCFDICYNKLDLKSFKECYLKCESFQNKKSQYLDDYLMQTEDLIEGRVINNNVKTETKKS